MFEFADRVYKLCVRYLEDEHFGTNWVMPANVYAAFNRIFNPLMEYFASPLNVNPLSKGFFSYYEADEFFGGNHDAFSALWSIPGLLNPPYKADII
jgi:hypothetical protein